MHFSTVPFTSATRADFTICSRSKFCCRIYIKRWKISNCSQLTMKNIRKDPSCTLFVQDVLLFKGRYIKSKKIKKNSSFELNIIWNIVVWDRQVQLESLHSYMLSIKSSEFALIIVFWRVLFALWFSKYFLSLFFGSHGSFAEICLQTANWAYTMCRSDGAHIPWYTMEYFHRDDGLVG